MNKYWDEAKNAVSNAINPQKNGPVDATGASSSQLFSSYQTNPSSPMAGASGFSDAGYWFTFNPLTVTNWNKDLGYQLAIIDGRTGVPVKMGQADAVYTFPINPSSISITTPVASTVEVTNKGVNETNNGAPLRMISIAGTTGVLPVLKALTANSASYSGIRQNIEYAFKNSIKALGSAAVQTQQLQATFTGNKDVKSPLNKDLSSPALGNSEFADLYQTGFAKIHDLKRFLDFYISAKKEIQNKSWRLVFICHKDEEQYYCTLNNYATQKSAGTIEYGYTINMTAWRRSPINAKASPRKIPGTASVTSDLARIFASIVKSRQVLASYLNVLSGIRSDINDSFITPVGETILLTKDVVGAAFTMGDFAFSGDIIRSTASSLKNYYASNQAPLLDASARIKQLGFVSSLNSNGTSNSALTDSVNQKLNDGKADDYISSEETADPFQVLLNNPSQYPEIFDNVQMDSLDISEQVTNSIDSIMNNVRSFTAEDIITRKEKILDFSRSISEALGGGSDTYNRVNGQNALKKSFKKLTTEDIMILDELNNVAMELDSLIANMDKVTSEVIEDYYSFYKDYAVSNGLNFSVDSVSKFYIPFPHGGSLEMIALQYLGDADRWIELVALNALKAPYVDEDGVEIKVLASSGGNTLSVGSDDYVYVGQVVEVSSDTQPTTVRKIREIDVVNVAQTLITFEESSGKPLTMYKPRDNAKIKAFMPNTVNSNMLIAIPSTTAPKQDSIFKISPELDDLDKLARIAKIDLLLDSQGDVILTGGGDIRLAVGLANITQAAVLKVRTGTNTLLQDPTYGNPANAGMNTSDASAKDVADSLNKSFSDDPRFNGLVSVEVSKTGPAIVVNSLVNIANTDISLPISAELPKPNNNNT